MGSKNASEWEALFQQKEWGKYPETELVRFIARNFYKLKPNRADVRLLDLGSGPGASTWFMAREGFSVSAIDGSATAIAKLTERLTADGLSAHTTVADIERLPYEDDFFDGIVDIECIYANPLPKIRAIIAEAHRVLKPGGKLYSQFFGRRTTGYGTGTKVDEHTYREMSGAFPHGTTAHFTDEHEIRTLFAQFDVTFEILTRTTQDRKEFCEEYAIVATKRPQ